MEPRLAAGFFFWRSGYYTVCCQEEIAMKKMFIGNLPPEASEDSVRAMFSAFGTVRSISVISDIFTGGLDHVIGHPM